MVGRTQVGDQRSVVASDQGSTLTGADLALLLVVGNDASSFILREKLAGELVLAHRPEIAHLARAQHVGSASGGVLRGASCDELNIWELQQLVEDGHLRLV